MADLSLNGSRRKRPVGAEASVSSGGGTNVVPLTIALILVAALGFWLIAPNQVDRTLTRTASAVAGDGTMAHDVWDSVVTTLGSEDGETESDEVASASAVPDASLPQPAMLQPSERVASGST